MVICVLIMQLVEMLRDERPIRKLKKDEKKIRKKKAYERDHKNGDILKVLQRKETNEKEMRDGGC